MNEVLRTIHSLHSTHGNFLPDRAVSDSDLETILNASVRAATASARQSYSIIVVHDQERMAKVVQYQAPVALFFCVDYSRINDLAEHLGSTFPSDSLMLFLAGVADTLLAAQTAVIAARSLGIDSLLTNAVHRTSLDTVYTQLALPREHCFPLLAILLGYEDGQSRKETGRLAASGVIHHEQHHRLTTEELDTLTSIYDDPTSGLTLNADWQAEGFKHYLEWFYAKRARRFPALKEHELLRYLIDAGFIPPVH